MTVTQKKVLMFLLNDFNPDNRVLKEAISLQQNNYQVFIVATHFNKSLKYIQTYERGIKVIRLNIISIPFVKYIHFWIKSINLFKNSTFDAIVCHDLNTLPIGVRIKDYQNGKPKLIYDSHEFFPAMLRENYGFVFYWIFLSLEKRLIHRADYITTDSPSRSLNLKNIYKLTNPITHIYNSSSENLINIEKLKINKREDQIYFALVGHVVPATRGFEMLPEVISNLKQRIPDLSKIVKILVLGDGSFRPIIQKKLIALGHNDVVKFYGHLPHDKAISLIKNCDVGLILFKAVSLNPEHAGPNRIFDYMAAELAIITTNLTEISRIVKKDKIGWIIPQNNPGEIAKLILSITQNKESLDNYKSNAKKSYEKYTWEKMEEKILKIYDYLLENLN